MFCWRFSVVIVSLLLRTLPCKLFEISVALGYRDSLDDKSKANLVQIKGRFSVTSESLDVVKVRVHNDVLCYILCVCL